MKVCYFHFPVITVCEKDGDVLCIKHYLGEIDEKKIRLQKGCKVWKTEAKKDDLWVTGTDLEAVSLSCN